MWCKFHDVIKSNCGAKTLTTIYMLITHLSVLLLYQDPLYSQYKRLHCELTPIDVDSQEFSMVFMDFCALCDLCYFIKNVHMGIFFVSTEMKYYIFLHLRFRST